jgi:hypothetical protein
VKTVRLKAAVKALWKNLINRMQYNYHMKLSKREKQLFDLRKYTFDDRAIETYLSEKKYRKRYRK